MTSDMEAMALSLRLPPDVATGLLRWPVEKGRRVKRAWEDVIRTRRLHAARAPTVG